MRRGQEVTCLDVFAMTSSPLEAVPTVLALFIHWNEAMIFADAGGTIIVWCFSVSPCVKWWSCYILELSFSASFSLFQQFYCSWQESHFAFVVKIWPNAQSHLMICGEKLPFFSFHCQQCSFWKRIKICFIHVSNWNQMDLWLVKFALMHHASVAMTQNTRCLQNLRLSSIVWCTSYFLIWRVDLCSDYSLVSGVCFSMEIYLSPTDLYLFTVDS